MTDLSKENAQLALQYVPTNISLKNWQYLGYCLFTDYGYDGYTLFDDWYTTSTISPPHNSSHRSLYNNYLKLTSSEKANYKNQFLQFAQQYGFDLADLVDNSNVKYIVQKNTNKKIQYAEQRRLCQELELKFNNFDDATIDNCGPYLYQKLLTDPVFKTLSITLKRGYDKASYYHGQFLAWPLYDIFTGEFNSYERIYDIKKQNDKGKLQTIKYTATDGLNSRSCLFLGDVNSADTIYIVGGLADGISAHISTNACIAIVAGELSIPKIAKYLNLRYDKKTIISAPDNDATGRKVAFKSTLPNDILYNTDYDYINNVNNKWTVPQVPGADWSDIYVNYGPNVLAKQLLGNIRGYDKNIVQQRYLDINIMDGLNLVKSPKGTGKSTSTADFIKNNPQLKSLIISYRVGLTSALAKQMDADWYQDLVLKKGNGDVNQLLKSSHRLVITPDSLHRLEGTQHQWDVVFVDEVEQTLGHFLAKTMRHKTFNLSMFDALLKYSKYQILADANLADITIGYCHKLGLDKGTFHINTKKMGENKKIYIYNSKSQCTENYIKYVASGKAAPMAANTKRMTKNIHQQLLVQESLSYSKLQPGESLCIHGDNSSDIDQIDFINNCNKIKAGEQQTLSNQIKALVYSPSIGTGLSVDQPHPALRVYGIFNHSIGTAEQAHQMIARYRDVNEYHVWLDTTTHDKPLKPDDIKRLLLVDPNKSTLRLINQNDDLDIMTINPDTGFKQFSNENFEWLYCHVKAFEELNRAQFKDRFLQIAKEEGFEIIDVAHDELQHEIGISRYDGAQKTIDNIYQDQLSNSQIIYDDDDFTAAMRGEKNYSKATIDKTHVYRDLNFKEFNGPDDERDKIINNLAFEQSKSYLVSGIINLALPNLPLKIARKLDIRDYENCTNLSDPRHTTIRRKLLTTFLGMAGISPELDYNGKTWTDKQLKKLRVWMLKYKEQLFSYLGWRITKSTLEHPARWFHQRLKSCGIHHTLIDKIDNGKTRVYGLDQDHFKFVANLAKQRNSGIIANFDNPQIDPKPRSNVMADNPIIINKTNGVSARVDKYTESDFVIDFKLNFDDLSIIKCALNAVFNPNPNENNSNDEHLLYYAKTWLNSADIAFIKNKVFTQETLQRHFKRRAEWALSSSDYDALMNLIDKHQLSFVLAAECFDTADIIDYKSGALSEHYLDELFDTVKKYPLVMLQLVSA